MYRQGKLTSDTKQIHRH